MAANLNWQTSSDSNRGRKVLETCIVAARPLECLDFSFCPLIGLVEFACLHHNSTEIVRGFVERYEFW